MNILSQKISCQIFSKSTYFQSKTCFSPDVESQYVVYVGDACSGGSVDIMMTVITPWTAGSTQLRTGHLLGHSQKVYSWPNANWQASL